MGSRKDQEHPSVRADYLRGDPAEQGPITRGRLELEPEGLHFRVPGGPDLRIELERLEALTISGRSPYQRPRRHARGTMLVAARRNGTVDVWEFAVARNSGALMQDRINRELHARGLRRPPLPFVEQLVGPVPAPEEEGAADGGIGLGRRRAVLIALAGALVLAAEVVAVVFLVG